MKKSFDRYTPYNDLPLLPPSGDIVDKDILLEWGYASRNLAELNKNLHRLPNPGMLINTITLQEAKSSSEIENIFTTEDELYKAISSTINEEYATPSTKEVIRYREALWTGYNIVKEKKKLVFDVILEIYRIIKNTKQGIRGPQSQVVIRKGDSRYRPGDIVYTPPRGKGIVEPLIKNLITYLSDNSKHEIDPLLKMAVAHYQFEAIHPFADGNGRTGRIINILYLVQQGLLSFPVLYLSKYIIENKEEYYFTLGAVTQQLKWKPWLVYMMRAVQSTAAYTSILIDDIADQMAATLHHGKKSLKWYTKEINEILFTQPYIRAKLIGDILHRTSRTTLTKYMQQLTHLGILSPKQDGKEVYYLNNDLIRILEG